MNLLKDWYDTLSFIPFLSVKIKIFIYNCDNDNSTENDCFIYLFLHVMINILLTPVYLTYLPCSLLPQWSIILIVIHCSFILLFLFSIYLISLLFTSGMILSLSFSISLPLSPLFYLYPFPSISFVLSFLTFCFSLLFLSHFLNSFPLKSSFRFLSSLLLLSSPLLSSPLHFFNQAAEEWLKREDPFAFQLRDEIMRQYGSPASLIYSSSAYNI